MTLAALVSCVGSNGGSGGQGGGGSGAQGGSGASASGGTGGSGAQGGSGASASGGTGGSGAQGGSGASASGGTGGAPQGIGTPCPFGNECPPTAPACVSEGVGDATAYCSIHDCEADADCPATFYCGITRDPHALCGASPPKGDNAQCGETNEPCIDPATDTTTIFEGSLCLLRRTCLRRGPCAPCSNDADCAGLIAQKCVSVGGSLACARTCGDDGDCLLDQSCSAGSCVPRFGACAGTGQFCEPCVNDEDCGGAGTLKACARLHGGMRACFDFAFAVPCASSADCPSAPSGKKGTCLDESLGVDSGSPYYKRCYLPIDPVNNVTSCW